MPSHNPGTAGPVPVPLHSAGNRRRAPLQAPQPQSTSPRDPHLGGPMSSVTHLPVTPRNRTRAPPQAPQPQSDPHLGGPMSSVTHLPVPPRNRKKAPLQAPQPQSTSPNISPSKYKPPQTRSAKNPPLNCPSKYKPPGGLVLGNVPRMQSQTKQKW